MSWPSPSWRCVLWQADYAFGLLSHRPSLQSSQA